VIKRAVAAQLHLPAYSENQHPQSFAKLDINSRAELSRFARRV
jgi:hypothetical protein